METGSDAFAHWYTIFDSWPPGRKSNRFLSLNWLRENSERVPNVRCRLSEDGEANAVSPESAQRERPPPREPTQIAYQTICLCKRRTEGNRIAK